MLIDITRRFTLATALLLVSATSAVADVSITLNGGSGSVASSVDVTYDYAALDADDVGGFQFELLYDPAVLTPNDLTRCFDNAPGTHQSGSCTEPNGADTGVVRVIAADLAFPIDEVTPFNIAVMGSIGFSIDQPGTHDVIFANPVARSVTNAVVPITGSDTTITGVITGAAGFASSPAPGSSIALGPSDVGSASALSPQLITVSEIGDQTLNVTALTFTGANASAFSTTTAPFMIADAGADVDVDVNCTPDARGDLFATLELTNNSINEPNPQYDLNCMGLSPNVQVPAGPVAMSSTVAGADATANITVTNPQDGFTSTANGVTATAGAGDAQITVTTGGPTNIAPDGSFNFVVSCDSSAEGNFSRTIDFAWTDPVGTGSDSIQVDCTVSDTAPIYNSDPVPGTALALVTAANTQSAPDGLDINNANTNPAADALTISSATASDPVFTVNVITSSFPANAGPDGTDDIEVTCTPPGVGTINGTLTVQTNDPNQPGGGFSYPLSCEGTGDALTTNPDNGGTLNLGTVPPGTPTGEGLISFTNNLISGGGSVSVDCSVTDTAGVFTYTPDPVSFTVAEGDTESAAFQCTPTDVSNFTASVSCDFSGAAAGTADYTVVCAGRPLVIPTMSRWGLVVMSLVLLMVAGVAGRRMMA